MIRSSPSRIPEERFETAEEFIDELRLTNTRWTTDLDRWHPAWIFRGQSDAKHTLLPSSWRSDYLQRFKVVHRAYFEEMHLGRLDSNLHRIDQEESAGLFSSDEATKYRETFRNQANNDLEVSLQFFAEMLAVKEFTEFADQLGHPVPGADKFLEIRKNNISNLPEEEFLRTQFVDFTGYSDPFNVNCSAVALAQHHGIPTRLLDWTEEPLVAAFFAAETFVSGLSLDTTLAKIDWDEDMIAVWALSREVFQGNQFAMSSLRPIRLITVPRHEIGYLLAQKGLFTHDSAANNHFHNSGQWRPVEQTLDYDERVIKKLTLPVREASKLLRLLWVEGISRAHLMPTYDNVTRALATKVLSDTIVI